MGGVEYQVTKVDPTNPETKGMVYQVHKVTEEVAATLGGKVYRARIIKDPTEPTVAGKVYQIVLIGDPDDPSVKGKVYNAILTGDSEVVVVGPAVSPLSLPDAIANSLSYVKAFGGTEQQNIPQPYTQVNYVTNTAQTAVDTGIMIDFAKNYEFEVECRATTGSWYILQSRASASGNITGIHGATSGNTITLVVGNVTVCTSAITRTVGNKLYVKATLNAGTATLYVKDETANTEDTQTGSYGTSQPNPTAAVYLLGNAGGQYVDVNSDIYMARIKENDTVVMDYVPARQVATAGFYDTVSGTFKTAETPANLSADGNTVPSPDAPMDIVSNNGVLKVSPNLFDGVFEVGIYNTTTGQPAPSNNRLRGKGRIKVLPNTTYYSSSSDVNTNNMRWLFYDINDNFLSAKTSSTISATTPPNTAYVRFYLATDLTIQNPPKLQIEKGTSATPYMPYGQIYTDGTVETIGMRGGNLVDNSILGANINTSGEIVSISGSFVTHTAPVTPGETYTCNGVAALAYYTSKPDIGSVSYNNSRTATTNTTFTVPNDPTIKYVAFRNGIADSWVVEGSTTYNGGTATAEMLLKVGDYQDVQSILDGVVTRNVGVKVLDGTEIWYVYSVAQGALFRTQIADSVSNDKRTLGCLCNAYQVVQSGSRNNGTLTGSATNYDFINDNYTTDTSWKQYLADQYNAGTPVIVIYPLATPTTESVAGQTLQVQDGDNVLEITQASLTGLELEVEYQAAVSLTIQEVQDANLDPNVQVTII